MNFKHLQIYPKFIIFIYCLSSPTHRVIILNQPPRASASAPPPVIIPTYQYHLKKPFDIPLPPPPLPDFSPSPLQCAASMPEIKISKPDPRPKLKPILEEEDVEELENEGSLRKRRGNRNVGAGGVFITWLKNLKEYEEEH